MDYRKEYDVAIGAVRIAAALCVEAQQRFVTVESIEKKDRSPVTVADLGSQAVICRTIMQVFPGDAIVGEEEAELLRSSSALREQVLGLASTCGMQLTGEELIGAIDHGSRPADFSGRYWTVDPIDGTKGFLRRDQYAVALALIDRGRVVLGVLGCPRYPVGNGAEGAIFAARAGSGTMHCGLDGQAQQAVTVDGGSRTGPVRFCESVERAHASHETHARIAGHMGVDAEPYRIDSQAKYAAVARGDASLYLRLPRSVAYREKIWDHAAGTLVVAEAGGKVTDFSGRALDFTLGRTLAHNVGILASNGAVHDRALAAIEVVTR